MPPKPPRPDLTQLSDTDKDRLIDVRFARMLRPSKSEEWEGDLARDF